MKLRTCHETHYKACIRESCRYAAIQHLSDRNSKANKEAGRQDMDGIKPYIDLHATLAIVNKKQEVKRPRRQNQVRNRGVKMKAVIEKCANLAGSSLQSSEP